MPVMTSYPGVYVEEIPSGVHNIAGVSTSNTAFIDFFSQGPMGVPTRVSNFTEFTRIFGGLNSLSEASYAVMQYYLNGGQTAWVVRVAGSSPAAASAQLTLETAAPADTIKIVASSPGVWGENLQIGIDYNTRPASANLFNLVIRQVDSATKPTQVIQTEVYRNLSMDKTSPTYAVDLVNAASQLVILTDLGAGKVPVTTGTDVIATLANPTDTHYTQIKTASAAANDGSAPDATALKAGIDSLSRLDPYIFNLMCIPAAATLAAAGGVPDAANIASVFDYAAKFCEKHRAFLILDIPKSVTTPDSTASTGIVSWVSTLESDGFTPSANSAIYFPRLSVPDPLNQGRPRNVGVSGTLAGIYAATDASRGVWKAPAGIGAGVGGGSLTYVMNDADSGALNPLGINALRNFQTYGNVVWGARTMQGADQIASEWAYIPVRRTALFLEESLFEGLKWVVFEPNDDRLWSQIRLNVTSFLQGLFRQGAFQGSTATSAYFVKCDSETTTQADINSGVVNVLVGFAPLKPAEFVVLQIQQLAGQTS